MTNEYSHAVMMREQGIEEQAQRVSQEDTPLWQIPDGSEHQQAVLMAAERLRTTHSLLRVRTATDGNEVAYQESSNDEPVVADVVDAGLLLDANEVAQRLRDTVASRRAELGDIQKKYASSTQTGKSEAREISLRQEQKKTILDSEREISIRNLTSRIRALTEILRDPKDEKEKNDLEHDFKETMESLQALGVNVLHDDELFQDTVPFGIEGNFSDTVPFEGGDFSDTRSLQETTSLEVIIPGEIKKEKEIEKRAERLASFQSEFGISESLVHELKLHELSPAQILCLSENLSQITVGIVRERSISQHDEKRVLRGDLSILGSQRLGKMIEALREVAFGKFELRAEEKAVREGLSANGDETYKKELSFLLAGMRSAEAPEVLETVDGEIQINFAKGWKNETLEAKEIQQRFNDRAHEFAKIPREWSLETATRTEKARYWWAKQSYDRAKRGLIAELDRSWMPREEQIAYMANAEANISMNQFIQTCPDATKELADIKDKNVWVGGLASLLQSKGGYFGMGFLSRSLLQGAAQFVAGPIVATVLGGVKGWDRANAELRELDQRRREGNTVHAKETINMADARGEHGLAGKLDHLVSRFDAVEDVITQMSEQDPRRQEFLELRERILASLKERTSRTDDWVRLGRVIYGKGSEARVAQYELLFALARAKVYVEDASGNKRLHDRIEAVFEKRDNETSAARMAYRKLQLKRGLRDGAVFSVLGATAGAMLSEAGASIVLEKSPPVPPTISLGDTSEEVSMGESIGEMENKEGGLPLYEVVEGDSTYRILRTQIPELSMLGRGKAQEYAIATLLSRLSPEELLSAGISDPQLIHPNDVINVEKLREFLLDTTIEGRSIIDIAKERYLGGEVKDIVS